MDKLPNYKKARHKTDSFLGGELSLGGKPPGLPLDIPWFRRVVGQRP